MVERRSETAQALLEAGEKLFAERGYAAVSTRDLAEAAGVNLAAIQYHFGSKAKLFIEVVHSLMDAGGCAQAQLAHADAPGSAEEAAYRLGRYVAGFLEYLLAREGPQPCRMMVREVFTDHSDDPEMIEALIGSVVEKFLGPAEQALTGLLRALSPSLPADELARAARSITGQCAFYASHRPFLERSPGPDSYSPLTRRMLAEHISTFALRALRCDEEMVGAVVARLQEEWKGESREEGGRSEV